MPIWNYMIFLDMTENTCSMEVGDIFRNKEAYREVMTTESGKPIYQFDAERGIGQIIEDVAEEGESLWIVCMNDITEGCLRVFAEDYKGKNPCEYKGRKLLVMNKKELEKPDEVGIAGEQEK